MLCTPISRQYFHLNCISSISIAWDTVLALPSFGLIVRKFWYCNDSLQGTFYFHCGMNCTWMNRTWMNCICKLSDIHFLCLNPQLKFDLYSMTEISLFYSPLLLCLFKEMLSVTCPPHCCECSYWHPLHFTSLTKNLWCQLNMKLLSFCSTQKFQTWWHTWNKHHTKIREIQICVQIRIKL